MENSSSLHANLLNNPQSNAEPEMKIKLHQHKKIRSCPHLTILPTLQTGDTLPKNQSRLQTHTHTHAETGTKPKRGVMGPIIKKVFQSLIPDTKSKRIRMNKFVHQPAFVLHLERT